MNITINIELDKNYRIKYLGEWIFAKLVKPESMKVPYFITEDKDIIDIEFLDGIEFR